MEDRAADLLERGDPETETLTLGVRDVEGEMEGVGVCLGEEDTVAEEDEVEKGVSVERGGVRVGETVGGTEGLPIADPEGENVGAMGVSVGNPGVNEGGAEEGVIDTELVRVPPPPRS